MLEQAFAKALGDKKAGTLVQNHLIPNAPE
jgi:hypothetical protein